MAQATMTASGFAHDRSWMLVDQRGRFVTQRTHPLLATLPVTADSQGLRLGPVAGLPMLNVVKPSNRTQRLWVEVWKHRGKAMDAGDAAAQWCTSLLQHPVRLVYHGDLLNRFANGGRTDGDSIPVHFADGYPVLVTNQSSLDDLARRMSRSIQMNAFRPNLVLDGLPPWAEDQIAHIDIGPVSLRLCKPCTRCVIPSIDQITGLPAADPTPALKNFRFNKNLHGVTFGENAYAIGGIGDTVHVGAEARCHPR